MIAFDHMQTEIPEGDDYDVTVIGIGGAGSNVIDRLALDGMGEAEIVCMNTDIRALSNSMANRKVQLGEEVTKGLGAGGDPELGLEVAEASEEEIRDVVAGRDIIFICAGLGGGTGSGSAPYVARLAREAGAFVVVFAIMPFGFEGKRRRAQAEEALERLSREASALLTFENGRMGELVLPKEGIQAAFAAADQVIGQSVRAVTGIVLRPGLIRIGMDDLIRALENDDSRCLFGYGEATGESRAHEAITAALRSPLLEKGLLLSKSRNVLVHVTGGKTMTLIEVELLMTELGKQIGEEAQILFGTGYDPKLGDRVAVTVISSLAQFSGEGVEDTGGVASEASDVETEIEQVPEAVADTREVQKPAPEPRVGGEGELGLDDVGGTRVPDESVVGRSVAAAAMADIEEVVAETLLDLGMDEPQAEVAEIEEEEEPVAEVEEFVEIEEAIVQDVSAPEAVVEPVDDPVMNAPDEIVAEGCLETEVVAEPDRVEVESEDAHSTAGNEEVFEATLAELPEEEDADAGGASDVVDEVAESAPTIEGSVEPESEEIVPSSDVDDRAGVESSIGEDSVEAVEAADVEPAFPEEVLDEEEELRAEEAIEQEIAAVEEKIGSIAAAMGVSDLEPQSEPDATTANHEEEDPSNAEDPLDPTFHSEGEAERIEDEVLGVGEAGAEVGDELEEDEAVEDYFMPADEVIRAAESERNEDEVSEVEEPEEVRSEDPVALDEEDGAESEIVPDPEPYTPSPGYGQQEVSDEALADEEPLEEEQEPVLAMAADSGHADPANAANVGPRIGLVEPSPSDPSGQGMLELDPAARGRFDNSSPTVVDGEDLDVPTFLRKRKEQ